MVNEQSNNVFKCSIDIEKALNIWGARIDWIQKQEKAFYSFNWMANSFTLTAERQLSVYASTSLVITTGFRTSHKILTSVAE